MRSGSVLAALTCRTGVGASFRLPLPHLAKLALRATDIAVPCPHVCGHVVRSVDDRHACRGAESLS